MDAKRITNFSTKTTSQPLMQSSPHAPAKLQNRLSLWSRSSKLANIYRTDEVSYVRATLKHQLTTRYRCRTDISCSRNRALKTTMPLRIFTARVVSIPVVQWLSYSPLNPRFAGSIPAGVDWFFQSVKILSMTSFGRQVKPWAPCRRFTARKRTSEQNLSDFSRMQEINKNTSWYE